ncbi:MAG: TRAP transporter substrate-binding protein [Rhodobacteraceae bacterium]|nr:TRAP transporter substrate-binding protein [Paracoccaceae bacterium]
MTKRRTLMGMIGGAALALGMTGTAAIAQEVTLKMHHFLPPQSNVPKLVLETWANNVSEASDGRIKVDIYPSMQLGGRPPELMDQAIDGVADIVWTVVGYTPGRFPTTEVFELPFMMTNARAATRAYWEMFEKHMKDTEFRDVHILATWVHGPGLLHTAEPVRTPDDLQGMKIRGGSRSINSLLTELGATPVGMPVPAVPEGLSKGVIDGTTIPWEVTAALKVPELVGNHTEFTGNALYTLTFVLAMNKDRYASLPDDLKKVIDDNSGLEFSVFTGGTQADADGPARAAAVANGNTIITLDAAETAVWREASQPIYEQWIADMDGRGLDGQALVDEARMLIDKYTE